MHARSLPNPFAAMDSRAVDHPPAVIAASLLAGLRSFVAPRRADGRLLATFAASAVPDPPRASRTVRLQTLRQNPRPVPSRILFERMPGADEISLQSFVVHHPEATILIDPAVPHDLEHQAMAELQPSLRRALRPPASTIPTIDALTESGITPDLVLCTHAHWDHVSGLLDLPGMPAVLHEPELDWVSTGERAPAGGVRRGLAGRELLGFELDGPPVLVFERSHDLFGDGSVVLVDLAGHTPGSVGVLLATDDGPVILVGDAAWHGLQIDHLRQRSGFPGCLVDEDREEAWRTLHRLHVLQASVRVVPAHDHQRAAPWR